MNEQFTICIKLPVRVLSPNYRPMSRGGRFGVAAAAKSQKLKTIEAIEQAGVETLPWSKCEVCIDMYHKVGRRRDTDNAIGALKSMYDGIVIAGVVPDDTPMFMARPEPRMLVDKEAPRVEITIRRLEE